MRRSLTILALLAAAAGTAGAQAAIDPGMSRSQVVERLGKPASERSRGDFTYLFYSNGCERTCGTSDLVILEKDQVVDAVFRHADREYTGTSSSPESVSAIAAATTANRPRAFRIPSASKRRTGANEEKPARAVVGGLEVETLPVPGAAVLMPAAPRERDAASETASAAASAAASKPVASEATTRPPAPGPLVVSPAAVPAGTAPLIVRVAPAQARPDNFQRTP